MANPIAVKGIRRIVDAATDAVVRAKKRGLARAWSRLHIEGEFGFDREGELGVKGTIEVSPGVELPADVGVELQHGTEWKSLGGGKLTLELELEA